MRRLGRREAGARTRGTAISGPRSGSPRNKVPVTPIVLGREIGELDLVRAKRRRRLPVVLTRDEVRAILTCLSGTNHLFLSFLYGTGMRLMEGLRLRVKDVDFSEHQITVRDGKGGKDRTTMLPTALAPALREHL